MRNERSLSGRRRAWALLALGVVAGFGCSDAATGRAPTGEPIVHLDPPKSDSGSATAPGCDGVTESGTCEGTAAVYCDVARGSLSRSDCAAIGESCVVDSRRGATCAPIPDSIPPSGTCDDGIGYWDEGDVITRWDCGAEGLSCELNTCSGGAYCCGEGDDGDSAPKDTECCDRDEPGCTNPCSPDGEPDDEPRPEPPADVDCADIGYEGICPDAETLLYCVGDSPVTQGCHGGDVCRVDACSPGIADCCPASGGGDDADVCDTLGYEGECDGNTLRYCTGDTLHEDICASGCNPDCGAGVGACCDDQPSYDCDDVNGALGICEGNTLYYCVNDEITEQDCGPLDCEVDTCFENGADCC